EADPDGSTLVTMDTAVAWQGGQATHAPGSVPAREPAQKIEDLPGLRAQADQLNELLDLGFHHGEVLPKLGPTVALGGLIHGPAGAGKAALVRAVAGALNARVVQLWAPEIAALTNNDAAARLRRAAAEVRGTSVLLIADVEALAPRDSPGPLATLFRQTLDEL